MSIQLEKDYSEEDVVNFLKEEFERIIRQYPSQRDGTVLNDAQAFEIWFLHQELGISYSEANGQILDASGGDGEVDFIVVDDSNQQVLVGQAEYDLSWSRSPASQSKAIETFRKFQDFLIHSKMPDDLPDRSKQMWRLAKHKQDAGYQLKYVYITPKHFTALQEDRIREKSGIGDYDIISHDMLIQRGDEFLDGQTGMCNFKINFETEPIKAETEYGNVYIGTVRVKQIHDIVALHEDRKRLRALFASNVRTFLSRTKRSKNIADSMKTTLEKSPQEFLVCNNGITIECSKAAPNGKSLELRRASISNGCQTVMNIHSFFQDHEEREPDAQVLVNVIELTKDASRLAGDIARARNNQNPVDNRDLMSNNFRLVCLHHRLIADKLVGSEQRYYLLRKAGEMQTLLRELPQARGQYMWIDAAELAQCIAAVIRQNPYMSQEGISDLFGKDFNKIFPDVSDPTHSRCKFAWWMNAMAYYSYEKKTRWKGISDEQIYYEKDFKNPAIWLAIALVARKLKEDFSFNENMEQRFVEKCERWWYKSKQSDSQDFYELVSDVFDDAFRLIHSICRRLLGKSMPKSKEPYTTYKDMLKGPATYEETLRLIRHEQSRTYQTVFEHSTQKFVQYLRNN